MPAAPRRLVAALALAAWPGLASGQPAAELAAGTLLRLTETASVVRDPDEVVATLRAESRAPTAAAAQAAVNTAVAAALERARAAAGVSASTGGYRTFRTEEPRGWVASQELRLRAADAAPLLDLMGRLQERGLATASLEFRLTADAARAAREEAAAAAIGRLRGRAEAVARQFGLRVERFAELRVESGEAPFHSAAAPMMRAAGAAPPPVAEPAEVRLSASVDAAVLLRAP